MEQWRMRQVSIYSQLLLFTNSYTLNTVWSTICSALRCCFPPVVHCLHRSTVQSWVVRRQMQADSVCNNEACFDAVRGAAACYHIMVS
jgi:hypothetical protein